MGDSDRERREATRGGNPGRCFVVGQSLFVSHPVRQASLTQAIVDHDFVVG
jgi:hypothetical protein